MIARKFIIIFFIAALFTGCASFDGDSEDELPWNKPADWEGQGPQFGR